MFHRIVFTIAVLCASICGFSQTGENASDAISYTLIQYDSTQITGCPNQYSLGTSNSSFSASAITGTMAHDRWFKFVANATVVKIKVCSPTTFDAGVEVWNALAEGVTVTNRKDSLNATGNGQREYKCVSGLIVNNTYFVRVGRVSGSGAGTFGISIEHNRATVNAGANPPSCYNLTNSLTRFWLPIGTSTQWAFYQGNTLISQSIGGASISLGAVSGLCYNQSYAVYVQVSTNDSECGTIFWGYSVPYNLTLCPCPQVSIVVPTCGSTFSFSTLFNASYQGSGVEYQWRMTTNGGNTQLCSDWSTANGVFNPYQNPLFASCLRYGQIYNVQVRARKSPCVNETCWSAPCNYYTPPMPLCSVVLPGIQCGQYMSANDGFISCTSALGATQMRFRFTPVNGCTCAPIAPAITTPWGGSNVNPNAYLQAGNFYSVQAQWRINASACSGCNGSTTVNGQQTDWSQCCIIGINTNNQPADGTSISIGCMPLEPNTESSSNLLEQKVDMPLVINSSGVLSVDFTELKLEGNAELRMYDLNGRLLLTENINSSEYNTLFTLGDASRWKSGIYIITIICNSNVMTHKIFLSGE